MLLLHGLGRFWFGIIAIGIATSAIAQSDFSDGDDGNFDAKTGYRITRYRAPVPTTVPGGIQILAADLAQIVGRRNPILIDATPMDGAPPDPETGEWLLRKPHENIPGSTWLPNVGRGVIPDTVDAYYKENLMRLTSGDKSRAVVVYCQADCWMGWNAAKRAANYGYKNIFWLSDGTDGWRDWDGEFEMAKPVPMTPTQVEHQN